MRACWKWYQGDQANPVFATEILGIKVSHTLGLGFRKLSTPSQAGGDAGGGVSAMIDDFPKP